MCRHTKSWRRPILSPTRQRTSMRQATVRCRDVREWSTDRCCGTHSGSDMASADAGYSARVQSPLQRKERHSKPNVRHERTAGETLERSASNSPATLKRFLFAFQFSPMFITSTSMRPGGLTALFLLRCSECDQATEKRFRRADESVNRSE